ncbi:hypothetical protein B566_EDAN007007 [Ephemera danica]|nr:hypothetical protein B566_EDAN007007 [Ephemera danica]
MEEQRFLVSTIRNSEQYSATAIYWLGGQLKPDGRFDWADLSTPSFLGWPVKAPRGNRDEDRCLALGWLPSPTHNLPSGLYWQPQRCSLVGGYVCQRRVQETKVSLRTNRTVEGTSGSLTSPNYPEAYPANADFWTRVSGPVDSRLIFNFSRVDLEAQAECLYDFVAVWDEGASEPTVVLCGQHAEAELRVWLQFEESDIDAEWASLEVQLGGDSPPLLPLQLPGLVSDGVFISDAESLRVTLRTAPGRHLTGRGFRATYHTLSHVEETRVISLDEADNATSQLLLLPLNWPAPAPKPGTINGFTQRIVSVAMRKRNNQNFID